MLGASYTTALGCSSDMLYVLDYENMSIAKLWIWVTLWKSAELGGKMDADNRVVLNCGGIRHEVYKVWSIYLLEAENLDASV